MCSNPLRAIVCVSPSSWFSLWRNRQQVMWRLAKHYRVVFVEPQREPGIPLRANLRKKLPSLWRLELQRLGAPDRELWLLQTPPAIPYTLAMTGKGSWTCWVRAIAELNCAILSVSIRRALHRLDTSISILWLYEPFHQPLLERLDAQMTVFYLYDEVADFAYNRKVANVIQVYDEALTRQADIVFATSQPKYEKRRPLNVHTYLSPNGVDFDLFHQATQAECSPAPEIARIPRPIAGFVGWLGFQIDVGLLLYVSKGLPDWSLVLVGPDELPANGPAEELRRQKNVHFLGCQPLTALPRFVRTFDVGLIPYLLNDYVLSAYPLKLHEYLAAGLPVVATALPTLNEFQDVVAVADSREDFVAAITQAAQARDQEQIAARVAVARQNTWDKRVEEIEAIFSQRWQALHG